MKKKLFAMLLTASMIAGTLAGCSTYTDTSSSDKQEVADESKGTSEVSTNEETTLNVGAGTALTLNQFVSQASNDLDSMYLLMSSLFRYYDGEVENDACESYELSSDGLTYTFHLRDGLTYADGTAITAGDFEYAIEEFIKPDSGAANAYNYLGIKGATAYNGGEGSIEEVGIKATDDTTLEITLEAADSSFLNILAIYPIYPVTKEFVEQWGETYGTTPESTLCSGPYTLKEFTVDTSMTFEKNDSWWNAENEFPMKLINVLQIDSANTKVSMFQNGELDIVSSLDTNYIDTLGDAVKNYESNNEMFLWVNEGGTSDEATKCLSNENFRKALTYALDREAIGSAVSKGFVGTNRAVSSNYPGTSGKYIEDYSVDIAPIQGDVDLAKDYFAKALEELGYNDASELPQMSYISFERDDMKLLGETITDTWKQVLGITNIQFTQYPIATAIQNFYTGNYDFFMISLGCSVSPTDIIKCFTPDGDYGFFSANWKTDITDLLADANQEEFQSDEYFKKVAIAEEALLNEYSFVPLYNQTMYYALADGIEGYVEPATAFVFQFNHLKYTK
jgi:ABC-type oligopeptide transport system substrate-binding subunit